MQDEGTRSLPRLAAVGASAALEAKPAGWYVVLGPGMNKASGIEQAGHNRETTCYPVDD